MRYTGTYIRLLLSVLLIFVIHQLPRTAVPPGPPAPTRVQAAVTHRSVLARSAPAANYNERTHTWTLSAKVLQVKEVSIYGRSGSIARIEYISNGKPEKAWAAVRMDDYAFNDSDLPIVEGSEIILQVSGNYVSAQGVDWTACPGNDLYCQYASFIEGGFPVTEDFGGLAMSPSNMLIYQGSLTTSDWVNGILAWKIRHSTSHHVSMEWV